MIQMQHAEPQVPPRRQLNQNVQQADRIGSARHGNTDSLAGLEHAEAFDRLEDAVDHSPDSSNR